MLAKELINRLEKLGLLDQEIIEALREQLDQGGTRVTPEAVAKLLVDNGQLTHFQATKLIGELRSGQYQEAEENETSTASEEDLTFAEEEEEKEEEHGEEPSNVVPEAFVQAVPVAPTALTEVPDIATPASRPKPTRRKPDPQKSVWDSFRVYGYLGIIALLVLGGGGLYFVLNRENADQVIAEANRLYDQQNYQGAQDFYLRFLDKFPDSQHASVARTRVTMTELYKAAQFRQEPWRAVDLAKEKLPAIAEEEGMNEERGNLAALLVDIAANLASSAGRANQTTEKQSLLVKLDEQRMLMENPLYMPASIKNTLASQIKGVEEARARVQRDINRNIRLDKSVASMKSLLDQRRTKAAYDTREGLLREFPELHDHERLVVLIRRASDIQQTLVEPSTQLPEVTMDSEDRPALRSIVLRTLEGRPAPSLRGETLYLRAGGSVLAFDGEMGEFKWRRFVGYAQDLPPVRLEEGAGVLLSESSSFQVLRCGSEDGSVAWRVPIGEAFSEPMPVRQTVYVSAASGRLIALDVDSGEAKWATQIPQKLETSPGVDARAGRGYIPGDHSNLYVLDTRDGSCLESYYVGHDEGTIDVPPIPLFGHVFVMENAGTDYANVHVLRVDETGQNLTAVQAPFRLTGNVRIKPVIQGRRLIVLTDLGAVTVFDIEPTAERDQVTVAASLPGFYDRPTSTQMAVGRAQMWITGTRIARYELQINTGNVVRDWSLHEGDSFIGEPFVLEDAVVHARVLRGTSAIRVTAADPKSGEEIWHTDVGAPIAMIRKAASGFHVVTSQAALFELDRDALASGATKGPIENPGDRVVGIRFADPISIDDTQAAMINQVDGQSMVVYNPTRQRQKLRQLTMQLSSARPSGGALFAGGGIVLPLSSGRLILINHQTGGSKATPFQPESNPVATVRWTRPIALQDDPDQIVVADSRKKIYRLRIAEQIRKLASRDLEIELLGPAAGVGDTYLATAAGPAADFLVGYEMTGLNERFKSLLEGRVVWGPTGAGDLCLLKTEDSMLRGFDADGNQRFATEVPEGPPVGEPLVVEGLIVVAGADGWLVAVDRSSGELVGQIDLGQPVSATPFPVDGRLLIPGAEGVVYIEDVPGI